MPKRHTKIPHSQDEPFDGGDDNIRECSVCHQEFTGLCPLNSANCPMNEGGGNAEDDEDEDPDFDDVDNLGEILKDDEEVEKILEDGEEIPPEDLEEDEE